MRKAGWAAHISTGFYSVRFCWVTRASPHPFPTSAERTLLDLLFVFRKPDLPPYWGWKPQGKEQYFLTSKVFSERSRSFIFHQGPQNKAGSDQSPWTKGYWEPKQLGIQSAVPPEMSSLHFTFLVLFPSSVAALSSLHTQPSTEQGEHQGPGW